MHAVAGFGAAGVLTGQVNLSGNALLEFDSGQIASVASGAELSLYGSSAFVADAGSAASNSALTGLTSNAGLRSRSRTEPPSQRRPALTIVAAWGSTITTTPADRA